MTSATDNRTTELREKLTERGVKYDVKALRETEWTVKGVIWHANEYDGKLNVYVRNNDMLLTPEQAIAATLGSDDRHDEIYDAGFDSGIKATLQMLEGLIAEGAGMTEIEDWIDGQWKEYES